MTDFTSIQAVVDAVRSGSRVCWMNSDYVVSCDLFGHWQIAYRPWSTSPNYTQLFWDDGVTSDYMPGDFYVYEIPIV